VDTSLWSNREEEASPPSYPCGCIPYGVFAQVRDIPKVVAP
jgi:hypothetical protein